MFFSANLVKIKVAIEIDKKITNGKSNSGKLMSE
jgi:hypothetical protein